MLPTRVPGSPPRLTERAPAEILPALLHGIIMSAKATGDDAEVTIGALDGARALELSYDESASAVDALLSALS